MASPKVFIIKRGSTVFVVHHAHCVRRVTIVVFKPLQGCLLNCRKYNTLYGMLLAGEKTQKWISNSCQR